VPAVLAPAIANVWLVAHSVKGIGKQEDGRDRAYSLSVVR
jgi:hypothetical protein